MSRENEISEYFGHVKETLDDLDKRAVAELVELMLRTYERGGTVFLFGNGGSGATASHFCGDLLKGVSYGLEKRFKAICLNDNLAALMAIANDICYKEIFREQLMNFLGPDDLVIGISGSGNSMNVVNALDYAKKAGVATCILCAYSGGKAKDVADHCIHARIDDMEVAEDIHTVIIHCVKRILTNHLQPTGA